MLRKGFCYIMICVMGYMGFLSPSRAFASKALRKRCKRLKNLKKNFTQAARCYRVLIQGTKDLEEHGDQVAIWINVAVRLYEKAAKTGEKQRRLKLLEEALGLVAFYLKNKLYFEDKVAKSAKENLHQDLKERIGYATLLIRTTSPQTRVSIQGYQYTGHKMGAEQRWTLRPGSYILTIEAPEGKSSRELKLLPNKPHLLHLKKKVPKSSLRGPVGWGMAILGGVSILAGAVCLGVSRLYYLSERDAKVKAAREQASAELSREAQALDSSGRTFQGVGFGALIAGGVLFSVGLTIALLPSSSTKTTTASLEVTSQNFPRVLTLSFD